MEILAPEEEMLTIRDIAISSQNQIKKGDLFYLVAQRWWQSWTEYVNKVHIIKDVSSSFENPDTIRAITPRRPNRIDNSDLIFDASSDESEIHDTLEEGRDYVLLPEDVWNQLYLWYGGGPTLERKVIKCCLSQMELMVEVFPLRLCLTLLPKGDTSTIRISKQECIGELLRRTCEIFGLNKEQVCIWDYFGHQKHALLKDMDKTLDDFNIQMGQDILVEVDDDNNGGFLTASKNGSRSCSSDLSQNQSLSSQARDLENSYGVSGVSTRGSSGGGLTGLLNLGNTCFMNSAIQCLVHTPQFAAYFQEDFYQEINWQNPLGMVGELAIAFGELLRKLWAPGRTPVSPRPFKSKLARFAPQFSGYNQHDSQELLAFLLDGLHEDLNRVKERPYVKSKDANDRPDEEVADEYWANHIARNDSIIVDVCQGQYKSTLVCPLCSKVSVMFDPFMYLSLPLQSAAPRTMTVTVFTCDGSALPYVCTLVVPKLGRCRDLIQALSSACSLDSTQKFLLVEIRAHLIHRFLEDPFIRLSAIRDDEHLAAYKIPKLPKNIIFLQLVHRREEQWTGGAHRRMLWTPYGTPLVSPISCDDVVTRRDLRLTVLKMLSPLQRRRERAVGEEGDPESVAPDLPLQLVGVDNACIDLSVCDEKAVNLSPAETSMLIFMNWSRSLLQEYDTHYLEDLQPASKGGPAMKKTRSELLSLYSCLDAFLREEPLVPEDMWYCPQCGEMRQASKKLDLWRLPEVLVIHLKRFSYNRSVKHKLETFVDFPVRHLDLTPYVANGKSCPRSSDVYDLYALTNHYGGMGSGHYTAYIKGEENRWYNFDDNHISGISEDEVNSAAAYVLFYTKTQI